MLEEKEYGFDEIKTIMGCSDKQGIDRKLINYGINFESRGRGRKRIYTIKHISDPFKVYCILTLGIPPQANFTKILQLYYHYFNYEDFPTVPAVIQEKILSDTRVPVSRGTISKWLKHLDKLGYIILDMGDFYYYIIKTDDKKNKTYIETDRETYNKAWKTYYYHKVVKQEDPYIAYTIMYHFLGGHPYKKAKGCLNVLMRKEYEELIDLINDAYLQMYKN